MPLCSSEKDSHVHTSFSALTIEIIALCAVNSYKAIARASIHNVLHAYIDCDEHTLYV